MKINTIYNENCLDTMAKMPDNYIDLIVTSPPYDNLRSYKNGIGDNWNFETFKPIAKELSRIIKTGGIIVWVVGDATINGSESGTSFKQALHFMNVCKLKLHDTMIYEKRGMSFPSNNRCHQMFEYMFVFSKGRPKTFNKIFDIKNKYGGTETYGNITIRQKDGSLKQTNKKKKIKEYGSRTNIWKIVCVKKPMDKNKKHPAVFPLQLANDHIITWSNENDLIYDPFMGSGTTAKACVENNRNFIGSEISKEYCSIAKKNF